MTLRSGKQLQQPVENLQFDNANFQGQDEEKEVEEVYSDSEPLENNAKSREPSVNPDSSKATHQQVDTHKENEKADIQKFDQRKQ